MIDAAIRGERRTRKIAAIETIMETMNAIHIAAGKFLVTGTAIAPESAARSTHPAVLLMIPETVQVPADPAD